MGNMPLLLEVHPIITADYDGEQVTIKQQQIRLTLISPTNNLPHNIDHVRYTMLHAVATEL
jgi:hypothetical protein